MTYKDATPDELRDVMRKAERAFEHFRQVSPQDRARLLRAIATAIEQQRDAIVTIASAETNLTAARIEVERKRVVGHMNLFAQYIEEGSWVDARIDTALPDRVPSPRPDLRKMLMPLGPVVVFGASNFPLAYSTPGGDTASALAAGCTVVVKGHPAHAQTSQLLADIITTCVNETNMPPDTFQHVHGAHTDVGRILVEHPATKAVGFTGSFAGGKALFDIAHQRPVPIPVFAEMSSINPVFLLPQALKQRTTQIAQQCADSITQSVGQFCTNPGILLGVGGESLEVFATTLSTMLAHVAPARMLHAGIAANYTARRATALKQTGVTLLTAGSGEVEGLPSLATCTASVFMNNPVLMEEVFGPYSLLVQGDSMEQLEQVLERLPGQLTATIVGEPHELLLYRDFIERVRQKAGRVIINGVPTGVEVAAAMNHGGPFPATTDSRFTAVGTDAIRRFVRPVCFQNFPDALLPAELQEANPRAIWRWYNGEWKR